MRKAQKLKRKQDAEDASWFLNHINDVKAVEAKRIENAKLNHLKELEEEKEKIKMIAVRIYDAEIIRQYNEEKRMKYLEDKRKNSELKADQDAARKVEMKILFRRKLREMAEKAAYKVRMGTFEYHAGKYVFYNDIRPQPVPWVSFVDTEGLLIYLDPISNLTQRKIPTDAPIVTAEYDDPRWYDVIYGSGAYDKYLADIAFKTDYNANGGYYDNEGNWIVATGYYDENLEFIAYTGYYNEKGVFVLYPRPEGDLGFMV